MHTLSAKYAHFIWLKLKMNLRHNFSKTYLEGKHTLGKICLEGKHTLRGTCLEGKLIHEKEKERKPEKKKRPHMALSLCRPIRLARMAIHCCAITAYAFICTHKWLQWPAALASVSKYLAAWEGLPPQTMLKPVRACKPALVTRLHVIATLATRRASEAASFNSDERCLVYVWET
jgi:hypothetical protein